MDKSIYSIFTSLSGETSTSGEKTFFIRLRGCNLRCSYCDTAYAQDITTDSQYSVDIMQKLQELIASRSDIKNIILTGGEPLLQLAKYELENLDKLAIKNSMSNLS